MGAGGSVAKSPKGSAEIKKVAVHPCTRPTNENLESDQLKEAVSSDSKVVVPSFTNDPAMNPIIVAEIPAHPDERTAPTPLDPSPIAVTTDESAEAKDKCSQNSTTLVSESKESPRTKGMFSSMKIDFRNTKKSESKDASTQQLSDYQLSATDMRENDKVKKSNPTRRKKEKKLAWNSQRLPSLRDNSACEGKSSEQDPEVSSDAKLKADGSEANILQDFDEDEHAEQL